MARALRIEFSGAYYHVMARGNERRRIFCDEADQAEFLRLLGLAARRHGFLFHAYALMPNHYHLLLETTVGGLSRGMHAINGLYGQYFNSRYGRAGHLFQGRFKALLVDKNAYWLAVSRYIHQNPVKAGLALYPWDYPWSSCRYLLGLVSPPSWLEIRQTLEYFAGAGDPCAQYRCFLEARQEEDPWDKAVGQTLLGSEVFVTAMRRKSYTQVVAGRGLAYKNALTARPSAEAVLELVGRHFADYRGLKRRCWRNPPEKMAAIHLLREVVGLGVGEIGCRYGMNAAAVTQALKRFGLRLSQDQRLAGMIMTLERESRLGCNDGEEGSASKIPKVSDVEM